MKIWLGMSGESLAGVPDNPADEPPGAANRRKKEEQAGHNNPVDEKKPGSSTSDANKSKETPIKTGIPPINLSHRRSSNRLRNRKSN